MYFDKRLGLSVAQRRYAPGLRARLVMRHHPPGGQIHWIIIVRLFSRGAVLDRVKLSPPIRRCEAVEKHPWCAGVFFPAAGPEHAVFGGNPLVRDAGVVCGSAAARPPQLVEHSTWLT